MNEQNQSEPYTPSIPGQVTGGPEFQGPPVMTKAFASTVCGMLSLPLCFCLGLPSMILGGAAIYLGIWVRKHYRGNTASEVANLWGLIGIIAGSIGLVLGAISLVFWIFTGIATVVEAMKGM